MWVLLLLPAVLAQTSCVPACGDADQCVECNGKTQCIPRSNSYSCVSTSASISCNSTCNGIPPPTVSATACWDGSSTRPSCDQGKCAWVSTLCPFNPCDPSPCKTNDKCCVPGPKKACSTNVPVPFGAAYVCIAPVTCECPTTTAPAGALSSKCFDGSVAGLFCSQETTVVGTCSWKIRTCPSNPCNPNPCTTGTATFCTVNAVTIGGTSAGASAYTCASDPCAGVTCAGKGVCKNGACICELSRASNAQTQCADGSFTPVFNNEIKVCDWVPKTCPPPPPTPVCVTAGDIAINIGTDPKCVPPTDPCASTTCPRGLSCVPDSTGTKGMCVCRECAKNDVATTICYNGKLSQYCDHATCQFVANPDCAIADPCTTIHCGDGTKCVNMGGDIAAAPICVPREPCNPNPCTDPKTVCKAAIAVSSTAAAGGASVLADAKAYVCVAADPAPIDCSTQPCQNGGVCAKSSTGLVCQCQKGWKGKFCMDLDCDGCLISKQCRTATSVLSSDGALVKEMCVCNDVRFKGEGCTTSESGTDNTKSSPEVGVATREGVKDVKASITGTAGVSFQIQGGRLDLATAAKFSGDPIVVEIDRLDAEGKAVAGALVKGVFAKITICASAYVAAKQPDLYLVDATGLKASAEVCASINAGAAVPPATFAANCWTFPVCHASTYAAGDQSSTNSAAVLGFSMVTFGLALFAL